MGYLRCCAWQRCSTPPFPTNSRTRSIHRHGTRQRFKSQLLDHFGDFKSPTLLPAPRLLYSLFVNDGAHWPGASADLEVSTSARVSTQDQYCVHDDIELIITIRVGELLV